MTGRVVLNLARKRITPEDPEVLFYGSRRANVLVDVYDVMEDKIQAVLSHRSQLRTIFGLYGALVRLDARLIGRQAGLPYAERFRALSLPPLRNEAHMEQWSTTTHDQPGGRPVRLGGRRPQVRQRENRAER